MNEQSFALVYCLPCALLLAGVVPGGCAAPSRGEGASEVTPLDGSLDSGDGAGDGTAPDAESDAGELDDLDDSGDGLDAPLPADAEIGDSQPPADGDAAEEILDSADVPPDGGEEPGGLGSMTFGGLRNEYILALCTTDAKELVFAGAAEMNATAKTAAMVAWWSEGFDVLHAPNVWLYEQAGSSVAHAVAPASGGDIILAGTVIGAEGAAPWLARLRATGEPAWQLRLDGNARTVAGLEARSEDTLWLAGSTAGEDSDGVLMAVWSDGSQQAAWAYSAPHRAMFTGIARADGGGALVVGEMDSGPAAEPCIAPPCTDGWLVRVDAEGQPIWHVALRGAAAVRPTSATPMGDGWLVAGELRREGQLDTDLFALRLGRSGEVAWARTVASTQDDALSAVAEAGGGLVLAAGRVSSGEAGGWGYAALIHPSGAWEWQRTYQLSISAGFAAIARASATSSAPFAVLGGFTHPPGISGTAVDAWILALDDAGSAGKDCPASAGLLFESAPEPVELTTETPEFSVEVESLITTPVETHAVPYHWIPDIGWQCTTAESP